MVPLARWRVLRGPTSLRTLRPPRPRLWSVSRRGRVEHKSDGAKDAPKLSTGPSSGPSPRRWRSSEPTKPTLSRLSSATPNAARGGRRDGGGTSVWRAACPSSLLLTSAGWTWRARTRTWAACVRPRPRVSRKWRMRSSSTGSRWRKRQSERRGEYRCPRHWGPERQPSSKNY